MAILSVALGRAMKVAVVCEMLTGFGNENQSLVPHEMEIWNEMAGTKCLQQSVA